LEILHAATALPESSFLDHPHIAPVYEVGVSGGRPWLSARLIEGRSLAELLRQGPLDPRAAAWITAAVARAIHYAHRRRACHGRLAPERIVLDGLGLPYVTGFGLGEAPGRTDDLHALGAILWGCLLGNRVEDASGQAPPGFVDNHLEIIHHSCLHDSPGRR